MESRSIDTAKDATIDLMTLNNKIVNMRSTVKRSKTHIINKLTKNIANLKKKKGTEQEKEKNLQKAQRYLQEIQSIRFLKEDKITKYSIGNISTYEDVSKKTLSSGARGLARLADHHFIKEAVNKFREEHSDWRDLAAFMLIQQTGRKFKSQKKKKLLPRMENINASKLLTEAYTQGLFREDGFQNIEDKSEKKRKKNKNTEQSEETTDEQHQVEKKAETNERLLLKKNKDNSDELTLEKVKKQKLSNEKEENKSNLGKDDGLDSQKEEKIQDRILTAKSWKNTVRKSQDKDASNSDKQIDDESSEEDDGDDEEEIDDDDDEEEEEINEEEEDDMEDDNTSPNEEEVDDGEGEEPEVEELSNQISKAPDSPQEPEKPSVKTIEKDECVIKQLDMGDENSDSDDDSNSDSDNDSSDMDDSSKEADDGRITKKNEEDKHKRSKRGKAIPDFLTKSEGETCKVPRDPFFEGSDMEDDFNNFEDDQTYEDGGEEDDTDIQEKFRGNKRMTKSLFHKPGDEKKLARRNDFDNARRDHFDFGRGGGRGRGRGGLDSRGRGGGRDDRRGRGGFGVTRGRGNKPGGERRQRFDGGDSGKQFGSSSDRSKTFNTSQADSSVVSKPAEKLHPSWEASRKRKAEQAAGIKAFSGTKITFDDD